MEKKRKLLRLHIPFTYYAFFEKPRQARRFPKWRFNNKQCQRKNDLLLHYIPATLAFSAVVFLRVAIYWSTQVKWFLHQGVLGSTSAKPVVFSLDLLCQRKGWWRTVIMVLGSDYGLNEALIVLTTVHCILIWHRFFHPDTTLCIHPGLGSTLRATGANGAMWGSALRSYTPWHGPWSDPVTFQLSLW